MRRFSFWGVFVGLFCSALPSGAQEDVQAKIRPEAIASRIREIRMGDLVVKTRPGAEVRVEQVRHAFRFGTAIPNQLAENVSDAMSPNDRKMFLKILSENFNYAVHENALKWYDCEKAPGEVDYTTADRIWALCDSLGIPMRGHCLFWEKEAFVQPWVRSLDNDALRRAIVRRATSVVSHFKGRIHEFDLNNEMTHGDFFRRRLGYGIVNEMAWIAKAANPDVVLYVNDYGVLDMGYNAEAYLHQIETLLANGVPIGGIGCQGHLSMKTTATVSAERVQHTLDRLSRFGLPIKITECLFVYEDEQVQADELRKLFPIYFAHPNVEAILMWGFWEGAHWQPHCAMWRKDWTPRPQALAYRELVYETWWTRVTGRADASGEFRTRAFYGDYRITSRGRTQNVTLSKKEGRLEVRF